MSTLGVSSFLAKLLGLGESTVLDNAVEKLMYYEECTYTDEGYVMLGCSPSEVGHYVVGIYDDKSCFNMVGVKVRWKRCAPGQGTDEQKKYNIIIPA